MKSLPYKSPKEITVYQCRYCKCRFNSIEDHDTHHKEQHAKHGLPFNISMQFDPLDEETLAENDG